MEERSAGTHATQSYRIAAVAMASQQQQPSDEGLRSPLHQHYYHSAPADHKPAATSTATESDVAEKRSLSHKNDDEHAEHDEHDEHVNSNRKKRFLCWRLSKSRWIGAIGVSVLLVLLIAFLILWFAILGGIFQRNTDKVRVTLNYFDIVRVDTTPGARTLGMELSLRFQHDLPVHAKTKATQVHLEFAGSEFAALDLPILDMKSGEQEYDLLLSGDTLVTNADVFASLASTVITQQTLTIDTRAEMTARALGITKGGLKFERSLSFMGLNNFATPPSEINLMTVKSCSSSGLNLVINASVDNVASLGLAGIGALNLSLYYEQSYLGYAVTAKPELGIARGRTSQLFNVTISTSLAQVGAIGRMVLGITAGKAQFFLTGDNADATQVELLKTPLRQLNVSILYTNRLEKVAFEQCDLLTLVGLN